MPKPKRQPRSIDPGAPALPKLGPNPDVAKFLIATGTVLGSIATTCFLLAERLTYEAKRPRRRKGG